MTDVSPVTESEMKDFFSRLSTTFVGLSAQSYELEKLRGEMQAMGNRLDSMATDNANLRKEISDTYELVSGVERERDEAKRHVQVVEQQLEYLRGENKSHLDTISNLESEVRRLTDSIAVANRETQAANDTASGLAREVDKVKQSRDYWRAQAEDKEKEAAALDTKLSNSQEQVRVVEAKLASVQKTLGEAVALFANPAPEPAEPPIGSAPTSVNW